MQVVEANLEDQKKESTIMLEDQRKEFAQLHAKLKGEEKEVATNKTTWFSLWSAITRSSRGSLILRKLK